MCQRPSPACSRTTTWRPAEHLRPASDGRVRRRLLTACSWRARIDRFDSCRTMTCRFTTLQAGAPRVALCPDSRLRSLLAHRYEGSDGDPTRRPDFVIPAGVGDSAGRRRRAVAAALSCPPLWSERLPHRRRRRLSTCLHRDVPGAAGRLHLVRARGGRRRRVDRRPRGTRRGRRQIARRANSVRANLVGACTAARRIPPRPLGTRTAAIVRGQRGVGPARAVGRNEHDRRRSPGRSAGVTSI